MMLNRFADTFLDRRFELQDEQVTVLGDGNDQQRLMMLFEDLERRLDMAPGLGELCYPFVYRRRGRLDMIEACGELGIRPVDVPWSLCSRLKSRYSCAF